MTLNRALGTALVRMRVARALTQEDFSNVSSRTYVSTLERGLKSPTIEKIDEIAGRLDFHPVSLVALAYLMRDSTLDLDELIEKVRNELASLAPASRGPKRRRTKSD